MLSGERYIFYRNDFVFRSDSQIFIIDNNKEVSVKIVRFQEFSILQSKHCKCVIWKGRSYAYLWMKIFYIQTLLQTLDMNVVHDAFDLTFRYWCYDTMILLDTMLIPCWYDISKYRQQRALMRNRNIRTISGTKCLRYEIAVSSESILVPLLAA